LKARITQALEDSIELGKEKGDLKFLLHQFNKENFIIEWYTKGKIFLRISQFELGKENERTVILESTLSNFNTYSFRFNAIAKDDKVYFLQVFENKDGHKSGSYAYNLKLCAFDLKSKELLENAEEIELNFDKKLYGIKLVVPQSAPIKLSKIFAHVLFEDDSASLRSLMDDEGKLTTMRKSLADVPRYSAYDILYFDGSSQESK